VGQTRRGHKEAESRHAATHLDSLAIHVQSFLDALTAVGHPPLAVAHRRAIVLAFVRWTEARRVALADLTEAHLTAFIQRRPPRHGTHKKERAALRKFLAHLRAQGTPPPSESIAVSSAEALMQRYVAFLRRDRGLAENSVLVYAPNARAFLADRVAHQGDLVLDSLDAEAVRTFLLERVAPRTSESARLLTVSLRSLLRFLFLRGETPRDLSVAVPMIRTYRQATVPAVLSFEEMEQVLAAADRSTSRGRRDYAILLLLALPWAPGERGRHA
jgi:site-specific recombinase XerD